MNIRESIENEDGFSLVELIVAMSIGMVVLFGVFAIVDTTQRSSARTMARVTANQTVRPVLTRIMDELHSSCVSTDLAPIFAGSTDVSMTFFHSSDRAVDPLVTKRTITRVPGTPVSSIDETIYDEYGNAAAPNWTFNTTGATTRLITGITPATIGADPDVDLFRYYAYDPTTATIDTTPLTTPLSATDAAKVVQVSVTFAVTPNKQFVTADDGADVTLSDSALLRFSPASSTTGESLLPCA